MQINCKNCHKEFEPKKVLADMIFCDPPYNMNYKSHTKGGIMNDHMEDFFDYEPLYHLLLPARQTVFIYSHIFSLIFKRFF